MATAVFAVPRRSERRPQKLEVTLLAKAMGWEFQQPAHTINISDRGIRIITDDAVESSRALSPKQVVYVYGVAQFRLGYCRVVWVQAGKAGSPSEAGLEFLN